MTSKIETGDTNAAIEALEALLKAKIRLQETQIEAQPVLATVGLLFEPDPLDEDQKNVLRNGLKSLKKLLEAHHVYGEAVQQAEPARAIVNQLFGSQPREAAVTNGKPDGAKPDEKPEDIKPGAIDVEPDEKPDEVKSEGKPDRRPDEKVDRKPDGKPVDTAKVTAASKQ